MTDALPFRVQAFQHPQRAIVTEMQDGALIGSLVI
jgi:hypothetical protein